MNNLILVGAVNNFKKTDGPGTVIINLLKQFESRAYQVKFINTSCKTFLNKLNLLLKLFFLLFYKNRVINVHSYGYKIPILILIISKINKKNKYYLTLHGLVTEERSFYEDQNKYDKSTGMLFFFESQLIRNSPNIIVVSRKLKEIIKDKYNRVNNVFVIYNGVEKIEAKPKNITLSRGKINTVMAGGIFKLKSTLELVNIIKNVNEANSFNIYLDIYGDYESDELLQKFTEFITKHQLQKYINYKGKVNRNILFEKFQDADLNFCISKFDTFNLTALESMNMGTPVVISKQCGAAEIILNYDNGFIIDIEDIKYEKHIGEVINFIMNYQEKFSRIKKNARDTAKKFNWESATNQYLLLFEMDN